MIVGAALRDRPCVEVDSNARAATEGRPYKKYPYEYAAVDSWD